MKSIGAVPAGTGTITGGTVIVPAAIGTVTGGTDIAPAGTGAVTAGIGTVPRGLALERVKAQDLPLILQMTRLFEIIFVAALFL